MNYSTNSMHKAIMMTALTQKPDNLLTEGEIKFMMENRIDFVKKSNPELDTAHDPHGVHKEAGAIVDHFATHADPSKNKAHTGWITNQYKKQHIRQEDYPRIHAALSNFDKYKPKLANKDLNHYKKLSDVEVATAPHEGGHATKAAETKAVKHEGAELKYDDENISIHHIKNEEASKHYGAGTKWCTAAKENNMFQHYHDDGPIHIIHDKKNKHPDTGQPRKYQFHSASNSFMNEKDENITPEEFGSIKHSFHKAIDLHPSMVE